MKTKKTILLTLILFILITSLYLKITYSEVSEVINKHFEKKESLPRPEKIHHKFGYIDFRPDSKGINLWNADFYTVATQVTDDSLHRQNYILSPDKAKLAYQLITEDDEYTVAVQVIDLATNKVQTYNNDSQLYDWVDSIRWSPDSNYISFSYNDEKNGGTIIDTRTDTVIFHEQITPDLTDGGFNYKGFFSPIVWLPDTDEISYISDGNLTVYNVKTKKKALIDRPVYSHYLAHRWAYDYEPFWSKSGRFVSYKKPSKFEWGKLDGKLDYSGSIYVYDRKWKIKFWIPRILIGKLY